jgi:hypothetical protein
MNKTKHLKKRSTKKSKKIRKYRKQKKYFGGADNENEQVENSQSNASQRENEVSQKQNDDREGIIDVIENKSSGLLKNAGEYVAEKGLRLVGLQPIPKDGDNIDKNVNKNIDKNVEKISNAASGLVTQAQNIGANILGNINEVLKSPQVEGSITKTAEETKEIASRLLDKFNQQFSTPEMKAATVEAIKNASEISEVVVDSINEPLDKAIDELNNAAVKAASGSVAGVIKVGTDALGAIPGFGAIVDVGKMINDGSKAVSAIVEAGSDAVETGADLFTDTVQNVKDKIKMLKDKKTEAYKILNRTKDSVNQFSDPLTNSVGGSKTTKNLFKINNKTKRVRFAL